MSTKMKLFGELKGKGEHSGTVKSPIVSITDKLALDLIYNDVPVTLFYKHGNYPWQSLLINNLFSPDAVPRHSDIYLSCSINRTQIVKYEITY